MKKLLLTCSLILVLLVVFSAVACTGKNGPASESDTETATEQVTDPATTTVTTKEETPSEPVATDTDPAEETTSAPAEETTAEPETPTETETEPETEPDTEPETEPETEPPYYERTDASIGFKNWSFDTFKLNGALYFPEDGGSDKKLEAIDNTVEIALGETHDSVSFRGWIGFNQAIDSFGYYINDEAFVFGDFAEATGDDVKGAGGEFASRFCVDVPLADRAPGSYTVCLLVKLADGKVVKLYEITVVIKGYELSSDHFHTSVDFVNGAGPDGAPHYSGRGGTDEIGIDVIEGVSIQEDMTVSITGWFITMTETVKYVWSVDGVTWYDCGGTLSDRPDIYTHALNNIPRMAGLDESAVKNTGFTLIADLTPFNNQTVSVTFAGVSKADETKVMPFVTLADIKVPKIPTDIDYSFTADANTQEAGTDLNQSVLSDYFTIIYGLGDPHSVVEDENGKYFSFGGINELFADVDGKYAFTIDIRNASTTSFAFVRGVHSVHPTDTAGLQFVLNNYYETDGNNLLGGAGIYGRIEGGVLYLMLKCYDTSTATRIKNVMYQFDVDSNVLTFADDGKVIYVLAGDKLITTITLSVAVNYDDMTISPAIPFAAKAEIVLADGTVETLENTLIASTSSQLGVAVRPGTINFTSLEVVPFSAVTIPEEIYRPDARENIAAGKPTSTNSVESDNPERAGSMATDGDDSTRWGAKPQGEAFLIVDLEDKYLVDTIRVHFENSVLGYTVAVSTDGVTYTDVYDGAPTSDGIVLISLDTPVEARYIRFLRDADAGADTYWFSIWELAVYGALVSTEPEEPEAPTAYSLALYQTNLGKALYFAGAMNGNFLAATDDASAATAVYLEAVEGGSFLYFMDGETKTYIEIYEYTAGKVGVHLTTEPVNPFVPNEELGVLTVHLLDTEYYLGTYKTFNTFSASKISYISGDNAANVGVSQFPAQLVAFGEAVTAPEA